MSKNLVRGYKVFNPDWTCKGFMYTCPGVFEENVVPKCCKQGFHFCLKAVDCFNYYSFTPANKVAEVIALGEVDYESDNSKCCTNKLEIVREIPWSELLELVNTGKSCTGLGNTGDYNTGDCNTGDWNTGYYNTGDRNTGDCNTGDCNTGDCNTGYYNTGDWNMGNYNTGCFNLLEHKIYLFDKISDWTYQNWLDSEARYLLSQIPKNVTKWVRTSGMTEGEKAAHPEHETTGGYLKTLDESNCAQIWWDGLSEKNRNIIRSIPNFDKATFEKITGIKTEVAICVKKKI